jgi:nitrite reductase/ring-hydroxylating ferredoxin subunit
MSDSGNNEQWEAACSVDALKEGRLIEHMSKSTLLVLAWVDDAPWAATGLCPHQFARLAEGRIEGGRLHCARHLASFCLRSGEPDDRWQISGIRIYRTRVKDGIVEVDMAGPA